MRLRQYLNENEKGRSKAISEDEAIKKLTTTSSQAFDRYIKGYKIFRTTKSKQSFIYTVPTGSRRSAYTTNFYTLIINNHPMWKNYPKREIICSAGTGERAFAHSGGATYNVFPVNGAKIGICSSDDIWDSFDRIQMHGFFSMSEFNNFIRKELGISNDTDWNVFVKKAKEIDKDTLNKSFGVPMKYKNFYDYITKNMSPEANDFELQKISTFNVESPQNLEVWTDQPCLLIDTRRVKWIVEKMNET